MQTSGNTRKIALLGFARPIPFIPPAPHLVQYRAWTSLLISALPPILCSTSQPATTTLPSMDFTSTTAPLTVTMTVTTRRTWWKVGEVERLVPAAGSYWKTAQPKGALHTKGSDCPGYFTWHCCRAGPAACSLRKLRAPCVCSLLRRSVLALHQPPAARDLV